MSRCASNEGALVLDICFSHETITAKRQNIFFILLIVSATDSIRYVTVFAPATAIQRFAPLSSEAIDQLLIFIENNLPQLKDPDEGEALDSFWQERIETEDTSQYGDFAITKYYNPRCNIGISYNWDQLNDELLNELDVDISPLFGVIFGPADDYFNPGKLGSYFQNPDLVRKNLDLLNSLSLEQQENLSDLALLKKMLSEASILNKGLYITF